VSDPMNKHRGDNSRVVDLDAHDRMDHHEPAL
jgi:hypothetical protein